jgi:competence protein ComEA
MRTTILCAMLTGILMAAAPSVRATVEQQSAAPPAVKSGTIDLNTATLAELESLPGIGRATAERIIEHRQKTGGFKKVEELMNVQGIGEKSFLRLKPLVAVQPRTEKAGGGQ